MFEQNDLLALEETLFRLYSDISLRSKLAEKGRHRVLADFTQANIASKTVSFYRSLVNNS